MSELAGNLPRGALLGDPNVVSAVVRPYQPDRGHGLTSCAPNHAPHPRVELSLTRTAAHPYQMSESEMGLTLPDSSLLTRGAGRPYPTQRLEMSPPDKGRFRTLQRFYVLSSSTMRGSSRTLNATSVTTYRRSVFL